MVEETTAAAQSLSTDTDDLSDMMGRFKTRLGEATASRAPAPRATVSPAARKPSRPSGPVPQMHTTAARPKPAVDAEGSDWHDF